MENKLVENKQPKMSAVLASDAIKELCNSLSLSDEQVNRAKSSALELYSSKALKDCDPFSLVKFCFETARYNFSRNDCIYPVPYKDNKTGVTKVQAQMGYKGFRELCLRSNSYNEINCSEVYDCDKVYRDADTGKIKVDFNNNVEALDSAKLVGFFAYATDTNGKLVNYLYWSKEKCLEHGKKYSKSFSRDDSLWKGIEFEKMAKKTVLKQLCNELKTTPDLERAIKLDQLVLGSKGEADEYLDRIEETFDDKRSVKNSILDEEEVIDIDNQEIPNEIEKLFSPYADGDSNNE